MIDFGSIPRVQYRKGRPAPEDAHLIAVGIPLGSDAESLDELVRPAAGPIGKGDFRGDAMETVLLYPGGSGPERLLLVGLGDTEKIDAALIRRWALRAAREARGVRVGQIGLVLSGKSGSDMDHIRAAAHGALLGSRFTWKEKSDAPALESVILYGDVPEETGGAAAEAGGALAEAILYARALAMEPANRLGPADLAAVAEKIAADEGGACTVLDERKIEKEGLLSLLAVGSGSDNPPRFIRLDHDGSGGKGPHVVLVGKGITFDSGGLSLKAAERMKHMKYDMSGAAAVLAAARGAAKLGLPLRLTTIVPSAENMPGPRSYRPGDVIGSYKGLTVEVDNTDAEGRLVLADGLAWAEKNLAPDVMVNAATLTGACKIALGRHAGGLFSNDDGLADDLAGAGDAAGQRLWRLPLWDEYDRELKSDVADMKNIARSSAVGGGAAVAARFLSRFVDKTPWAHIDIAGMAWSAGEHDLGPGGPTGYGAALLLSFLMRRCG